MLPDQGVEFKAIVRTLRPTAKATPANPMPNYGKAGPNTALPHPNRGGTRGSWMEIYKSEEAKRNLGRRPRPLRQLSLFIEALEPFC